MDDTVAMEGWRKLQILGVGSFGQLSLWEEFATKKVVAVKVYKGSETELQDRQRAYWIKEVEMMHNIDHPNIVRAVKIPEKLRKHLTVAGLPPLSMEYCRGGDLRRMLAQSENMNGMAEKHVRGILRDICKGLNYLHQKPIVHRDLKPENIVIDIQGPDRRTYKIIDLGYAKELGQASLAQSFVGTLAYLAPELLEQRPYKYTTDYWSLGILAFEIACGKRPFACNDRTVPDVNLLRQKKDNCIHITRDDKTLEFKTTMPDWCRLNEVFKHDLTLWLRTMLSYRPEKREPEADCPNPLECMLSILNRPLAHVLHVNAAKVVTFTANSTAEELYVNTMVPANSQMLLSPEGKLVQFGDLMELGAPRTEEAAVCAFLFHMDKTYNFSPNGLPHNIRTAIASSSRLTPYAEQRSLWSHMCTHVTKEFVTCCRVLAAYRALLMRINNVHSEVTTKLNSLSGMYKEVKALAEVYQADEDYDLKEIEAIGHSALDQLRSVGCGHLRKTVPLMREKMRVIVAKINASHKRVLKLRENPYGRSKPPEALAALHGDVLKLLENLRKRPPSARSTPQSNSPMVELVRNFTEEQTRVLTEVRDHIEDGLDHLKETKQALVEIDDFTRNVVQERSRLMLGVQNRRTAIWNVIKNLVARQADATDGPRSSPDIARDCASMPDVEMIVRENEKYRSLFDSLSSAMEDEVGSMTSNVEFSQNMASFL